MQWTQAPQRDSGVIVNSRSTHGCGLVDLLALFASITVQLHCGSLLCLRCRWGSRERMLLNDWPSGALRRSK